jgi:hypothetical protein
VNKINGPVKCLDLSLHQRYVFVWQNCMSVGPMYRVFVLRAIHDYPLKFLSYCEENIIYFK